MAPGPGLLLGVVLGFVVHRGDFCMAGALREACDGRLGPRLRAVLGATGLLALAVTLIGVGSHAPAIPTAAAGPVLLGGVLFGCGMVLSRACALSVLARIGTGSAGALVSALVFVAVVAAIPRSLAALVGATALVLPPRSALPDGLAAAGAGAAVIALLGTGSLAPEPRRWPWPLTATAIALLTLITWLLHGTRAWPAGLPMIEGARDLARGVIAPHATVHGAALMVVGIPLGSWASARGGGPLAWRVPPTRELVRRGAGGALMGLGAVLALGCSAVHGLLGIALLAPVSLVAMAGIVLGGTLTERLAGERPGVELRRVRLVRPARR